jgi:hypothetical protein
LEYDDGAGHVCFDTRKEAQAWCDDWNKQLSEEEKTKDRFFATVFEIKA